ncbi:MAG: hypothetical protein KQH57_10630 [Actinomycetales bacterium]|nr:hypothetical protein [Actinomycetales bacterium]
MSEQYENRPEERETADVAPAAPAATPDRRPRVATVVWGLVVLAVALGLMALGNGLVFDVQLAVILLVAGAGVALLVGSLVGARRRAG